MSFVRVRFEAGRRSSWVRLLRGGRDSDILVERRLRAPSAFRGVARDHENAKTNPLKARNYDVFAIYSPIACEAGRLRRSRCRNMKVGTISSISTASIR
jgi:hypothetical protein